MYDLAMDGEACGAVRFMADFMATAGTLGDIMIPITADSIVTVGTIGDTTTLTMAVFTADFITVGTILVFMLLTDITIITEVAIITEAMYLIVPADGIVIHRIT